MLHHETKKGWKNTVDPINNLAKGTEKHIVTR